MRQREGFHWFRRWRPTPQQERVLDALLDGKTNAEIADALQISADGTKWHVSQLLGETGLQDRLELAAWWRERREEAAVRRGLWPLAGLLARAALIAPVAVLAVWLVATDPLSIGKDPPAQPSRPAPEAVAPATVPPPPPSPTPQPALAWIFDLAERRATPVDPAGALMQWLDGERLLSYAGPRLVIVDSTGMVIQEAQGARPQGQLFPDRRTGRVLVLEGQQTLAEWDPATGAVRALLELGAPPTFPRDRSGRIVDVSANGRRVAVGDVRDGNLEVEVMNDDGSERRVIWREEPDVWLTQLTWSPDGRRLIVATATRRIEGARVSDTPRGVVVLDAVAGGVLYALGPPVQWSRLRWLGPDQVLVAGPNNASSTVIDVRDRRNFQGPEVGGLMCVSPDGRYGLYSYEGAADSGARRAFRHRMIDVASGETVMDQETRTQGGLCDWTDDGTKAVVSPGGK